MPSSEITWQKRNTSMPRVERLPIGAPTSHGISGRTDRRSFQISIEESDKNMSDAPINVLSICSGIGMLDIGYKLAMRELGYETRTIGYIEKDKFCQSVIRARVRDGLLDDGFIWNDLCTFAGARFRGHVDAIVGGFPCQPFSHAGKGLGLKDERYLFNDVIRIANETGAVLLVLENVSGLLSPDDVDDEAGDIVLRAPASDVLRLMAKSGFHGRWTCLGASDVGYPHGRLRWFCVGWRMVNPIITTTNL